MKTIFTEVGAVIRLDRHQIEVDRVGLLIDGERVSVNATVSIDARFVTIDSRYSQYVMPHSGDPHARDEVERLLRQALRRAREVHGAGRDHVPDALEKDR